MKWILLLVLILTSSPLWAAEQYTKAHCDRLAQQKELIRKRLNAGYGFAEGEQLDQQDRELFRMIAAHCTSPIADASADEADDVQERPQNHRQFPAQKTNVPNQQMPAWSGHNAIFNGDQAAAWTEFYQVPQHCRKKQLSEAEFVLCANHKAQQRELFEQKWQQLKFIPFILEDTGLLAAFSHPSHLELLSSGSDWRSRFVQLPPTRIFNDFGYSPVNVGAAQHVPLQTHPLQTGPQPVLESIPAYSMEPTNSPSSTSPATPPGSRYVENIQQQFHWVGIAIIICLTVLSWLIWRQ